MSQSERQTGYRIIVQLVWFHPRNKKAQCGIQEDTPNAMKLACIKIIKKIKL